MTEAQMKRKVNITVANVVSISERLEKVFGEERIAFIGGRAVNIWCYNSTRETTDVDVVVKMPKNKNIDSFDDKAFENGFLPKTEKGGKRYYSVDDGSRIDLYYNNREINGISIDLIVGSAQRITPLRDKTRSIKVATPAVLILMKYDTGREKDIVDIANLLLQQYSGNVKEFMEKEKATLDIFIEDKTAFQADLERIVKDYAQRNSFYRVVR